MESTAQLAEKWGIESGYFDVQGRWHEAGGTTIRRIAESLSGLAVFPGSHSVPSPSRQPAHRGDGRRVWILSIQLYSLRSKRNWGHGDFSDLARLLDVVADLGGAGVGLNPLHAQFHARDDTGSPYAPSSRLFLNPLYIDVDAAERFPHDTGHSPVSVTTEEIGRLRTADMLDYTAIGRVKLEALRRAYGRFLDFADEVTRHSFDAFRLERGRALKCFAAFETLRAQHAGDWRDWPEELQQSSDELLDRLQREQPREIEFHEFLQWIADRQLSHCCDVARRRGLTIGLYLDIAVGVDPAGADAWMDEAAFLRGLSVGAPPDQFNPAGQDWGLTTYNPHGLEAAEFEPICQMLRAAMRYAGAVRIDHVLGLKRLYVIPRGMPASQGAYIRMPFEQLLNVVADESRRWGCIVIGEDLGTVPEGFRETLASWGMWSYLVTIFERRDDGSFRDPRSYPENAVATFNTHDLPTYSGWIGGHDLTTKRAIGFDPGETDAERQASCAALVSALSEFSGNPSASFEAVATYIASAPTRLVSCAIEDMLGVIEQINVPGTIDQHPNWRRRLPVEVEEIASDQRVRRIASALSRAGRGAFSGN